MQLTQTATVKNQKMPPSRIGLMQRVRNWFVPKSADPEESFREQALRIAFPIAVLARVPFALAALAPATPQGLANLFGPIPPAIGAIAILVPLVVAYWGLVTKRITLSGIALMVAWGSTDVAGALFQGYWVPSVELSFMIDVILATLILPQQFVVPSAVIVSALYDFAVYAGGPFSEKFPQIDGSPFFSREAFSITMPVILLISVVFLRFLKAQLNKRINILKEFVATLETRIKERTAELEIATSEAVRANQVKSAFLASMSHELRTPLNAIINFTTFVAEGDLGTVNQEQIETLGEVVHSGKHLLALINDVLDMSKIESGTLTLLPEDGVKLGPIMDSVVSTGQGLLAGKSVELRADVPADLPAIRADRQRLLQVLLNVMSNACKFTEQGSITLKVRANATEVLISVQDTGPGIASKDHALVFEAFKQTDTGLRQGGGTGLGMPISRTLVEAHGGRFWLESEEGKGATFFVALPIKSEILTPYQQSVGKQ